MKRYIWGLLLFVAMGCKKDGLSKDTGNIEITVPGGSLPIEWFYDLYSEEEFRHLLNYERAIALRAGTSIRGKIIEKELLKGNYGILFYSNGTGYKKAFQVVPNKVNKYTFP